MRAITRRGTSHVAVKSQDAGGERGWWWARLAHHGAQESPEVATATPKLHACVPADIKMFRQIAKCMHARANAYRRRLHTDAVCTQTIVRSNAFFEAPGSGGFEHVFPSACGCERRPPRASPRPRCAPGRSLLYPLPPFYLRRQPRDTVSLGSAREKRRVPLSFVFGISRD